MKYIISLFLFFLISFSVAFSQEKKVKSLTGEFSFQQYAPNVIKLTYKPNGYTSNENVSDAVMVKPILQNTLPVQVRGEVATIGKDKKIIVTAVQEADGYRGFRIALSGDEKIFGGGERALPLNRRGYKFMLYNNPWYGYSEGADALNFSVPFFTSSNGYGLFFDNASKGYADIGKTDKNIFETGFVSGELNVYIILGNDYKEILSAYHTLTGTQPLPPRWAMGNFMSRFGYTSEVQTQDILTKMQAENIPVDAIIFDLFWFGDSIKGTLGNLDWVNKEKWPAPKKMIEGFSQQKINTVLIAEPFILKGTRMYDAAQKYLATDSAGKPFELTNFYFGLGGLLDIFRKDAGDFIWNGHYKKQIANGVNAWWTDLGEPEKHPSSIRHNLKDFGFKRLFGADEVHNVYGHNWNRMLASNYAKEFPNKRLFHLNRSGFAGSQRYNIFPWSGDVSRSWSGFRAQLPVMLGMSMSGIPYIHADAGGFAGGEGDTELYIRWLQFAAFTPIFRPHGTALYEVEKNAFSFPSEAALIDTPYRNYAKEVIRLRYEMLPYNYTLAYKQAVKAEPLVAPLYYHFPKDTAAVNVGDEFMWGQNILMAPVIEKGAAERKVYLPKGNWYAFHGNESIAGGGWISTPVSITTIPLYAKAGSIIITSKKIKVKNTTDEANTDLGVDYYYDGKSSAAELYEDDGVSRQAITKKQYQLIQFTANASPAKIIFTIKTNGGNFKGKPAARKITFMVHGPANTKNKLYINGKFSQRLSYPSGDTASKSNSYLFTINFDNRPVTLEIK